MASQFESSDAALELLSVSMRYRRAPFLAHGPEVLRRVSLSLRVGEIVAVRGANGSGKTTLLKISAGAVEPSAGHVRVFGARPGAGGVPLGFAGGGHLGLFPALSARRNLELFASLHSRSGAETSRRIQELSARLGMALFLDVAAAQLSSGMAARVNLARALIGSPRLILLDEPTRSLDKDHANAVRLYLRDLAEQGADILFTTHSEADVEATRARSVGLHDGLLTEETDGE